MALRDLPTSRINQIIDAVNRKYPKEALGELTPAEEERFDSVLEEALEQQERYGEWPVFEMGEIEYDDPVLDIYGRGGAVDRTRQVGR